MLALPKGEHNFFERKGGDFLSDSDFRADFAKALSAFANSGGGYIIIGQEDDGTITGVDRIYSGKKGTSTHSNNEWLEDIIPNLLNYPLRDFRVHPVTISTLPSQKIVIVIDIGDSKLAPHQTNVKKQKKEIDSYYQRFGSRSVPAEHHNLSLLFGRSRFPSKEVAESWMNKVINPLIDYLQFETQNLTQKKRLWENRERIFYSSGPPPFRFLLRGTRICDSDNLEQFFEFTDKIEDLFLTHDEIVEKIDEQFAELFEQAEKLRVLVELFERTTTIPKLLELTHADANFNENKPESLFAKLFGMNSKENEVLEFFTILMLNKMKRWGKSPGYDIYWDKYGEKYRAFLKKPPLLSLDKCIDKSYQQCISIDEEIIAKLKRKRSDLSMEAGIPVR